jgi:hypothetical protein
MALGNTIPLATRGLTFGADVPESIETPRELRAQHMRWRMRLAGGLYGPTPAQPFVDQMTSLADLVTSALEGTTGLQSESQSAQKTFKPAGQVVLFKKIMEQWGFSEKEASTLLGFEDAADVRDIYEGRKPVGQRDANDRLRAVLRIAADIDALFREKDAIRGWLNESQKDLGGQTPRDLLNEGSMENLLRVKYYVSYLSGR